MIHHTTAILFTRIAQALSIGDQFAVPREAQASSIDAFFRLNGQIRPIYFVHKAAGLIPDVLLVTRKRMRKMHKLSAHVLLVEVY